MLTWFIVMAGILAQSGDAAAKANAQAQNHATSKRAKQEPVDTKEARPAADPWLMDGLEMPALVPIADLSPKYYEPSGPPILFTPSGPNFYSPSGPPKLQAATGRPLLLLPSGPAILYPPSGPAILHRPSGPARVRSAYVLSID
jgi:hypothetical protein